MGAEQSLMPVVLSESIDSDGEKQIVGQKEKC